MHRSRSILPLVLALAACASSPRTGSPASRGATGPAHAAAALNESAPQLVRLRVGDGPASAPMPHPAQGKATLVLSFPRHFAGRRVELVVDRGAGDDRVEWLRFTPRVLQDGTLQVQGLQPGCYALRAEQPGTASTAFGSIVVDGPGAIAVPMSGAVAGPGGGR
ncbi:MAG: hypothetical protein AB7O97_12770 [Planctomycetota bacterium]